MLNAYISQPNSTSPELNFDSRLCMGGYVGCLLSRGQVYGVFLLCFNLLGELETPTPDRRTKPGMNELNELNKRTIG